MKVTSRASLISLLYIPLIIHSLAIILDVVDFGLTNYPATHSILEAQDVILLLLVTAVISGIISVGVYLQKAWGFRIGVFWALAYLPSLKSSPHISEILVVLAGVLLLINSNRFT